jgi:hypothetical protein
VTVPVPSTLYPGVYPITATYSGIGNVYKSASQPFELTVLNSTATYIYTSSNSVTQGQNLTISASITQDTSYYDVIGGTLTILADGEAIATVPVTSGAAGFTASTSGIAKGTYTVTARYSGDASNAPSTSPPIQITVQ